MSEREYELQKCIKVEPYWNVKNIKGRHLMITQN